MSEDFTDDPAGHPARPEILTATEFADLAAAGRTDWWRFLLVIILVPVLMMLAAVVIIFPLEVIFDLPLHVLSADPAAQRGFTDYELTVTLAVGFGLIALATPVLILLVWALHRRGPMTLLTGLPSFAWGRVFASLAIAMAVFGAQVGIAALIWPEAIATVFDAGRFFKFLPLILVLIPVQVLGEEIVFRGYLVQTVGAATRRFWVRLIVPAVLFAAMHLPNPEAAAGGVWAILDYLVIALYLTYLALRTNGLEHAFGVHMGINFSVALVATSADSAIQTPTLFRALEQDFMVGFLGTLVMCAVHYLIVIHWPPRAR